MSPPRTSRGSTIVRAPLAVIGERRSPATRRLAAVAQRHVGVPIGCRFPCVRRLHWKGTFGRAHDQPIAAHLLATGGFKEGKVGGRGIGVFETDRQLACVDKPGYRAVGDGAAIPSPTGEGLCPPTAVRQWIFPETARR